MKQFFTRVAEEYRKQRPAQKNKYASFNARVLATIIDMTLSFGLLIPVIAVTAPLIYQGTPPGLILREVAADAMEVARQSHSFSVLVQQMLKDPRTHDYFITHYGLLKFTFDQLLQLAIFAALFLWFWFHKAATPGKMLLGLKIVDANTLEPASRRQFVIRFIVGIISALPLFLGFVWMIFNRKKQAWHDLAAGTVVIKK